MFEDHEIISTIEMVKNEHLDVRAVTLGINLFDCISHDLDTFRHNIRKKITGHAASLKSVCDEVGDKYGIQVVNKRISISPIALVGAAFSADQMVEIAHELNDIAQTVGIDFIGGFSALVEKGMATGDTALIQALPRALAETQRVCASVNVATTKAGINMDAVLLMGPGHQAGGGTDRRPGRPGLCQAVRVCQHSRRHAVHGRGLPGAWAWPMP